MAVVFTDSAGNVQSRPPQAEMEIVFRPAPGGGNIAVGVSGAPVRELPGDTPRTRCWGSRMPLSRCASCPSAVIARS